MIITDLSGIFSAVVYMGDAYECAKNPSEQSKKLIKHAVYHSVRHNYCIHKKTYGDMILACDNGSWRYDFFPEYKHQRKVKKETDTSGIDWKFVNEVKAEMIDDLKEYFPYPTISVKKCEGDDVIAVLTKHITENIVSDNEDGLFDSEPEPIMILSSDNDMSQLQKYKNVKQWSPRDKKLVRPDGNLNDILIEKYICGESGDGIPNILCPNDYYVNKPDKKIIMSAKKKKAFVDAVNDKSIATLPEYTNFKRNATLISFNFIPASLQENIIQEYEIQKNKTNKAKFAKYLAENNFANLYSSIHDFY